MGCGVKAIRRRVPRYVEKIADVYNRARAMGRINPGAFVVDVMHDEWCPLLLGTGACSCDVEIGQFHEVRTAEVV